ncbi:hypothetical protein HY358_01075 [Candidatus Roizmanbacteria bacterium]|nr:hypothetical protein [Candidatus Roizmanbacteria bacterium]
MIYMLIFADVLMVAAFLLKFNSLPPQIPLIYSQPWGEDQLVDYWVIVILPLLLHFFFFLNVFIYNKLFFPDHLIRRIIVTTNYVLTIGFTFIFLKIVFHIS